MKRLTIPGARFYSAVYLDGRKLLTFQREGTEAFYRLWDLGTDAIGRAVTSEDGRILMYLILPGCGTYLRRHGLWPDGEELPPPFNPWLVQPPHPFFEVMGAGGVTPMAFRPDGSAAIFPGIDHNPRANGVRFRLRDDGGTLHPLGAARGGWCAAFSTDGRLAAMGGVGDRFVSVWDTVARQEVCRLQQADCVRLLHFTGADRLAVSAGRGVSLWDVARARLLYQLPPFRKHVRYAAVAPGGRLLAAGGRNRKLGVWDPTTGGSRGLFDWGVGEIQTVAFSPDGSTAAAAGRNGVVVWDID